ncbi:MAG: hypothetical protein RLZZ15_3392 [Verrucomicrobiota bacterium]|jgi:hypothetical protein
MSAKLPSSLSRRLLAALSVAAIGLTVLAPSARAVTISSTVSGPNAGLLFPNFPLTETNPAFATFNFASALAGGTVTSLGNVNITLSIFNLDTNVGGLDNGNIFLSLGGFNTGIALNGFTNGLDTLTFNSSVLLNSSAIIAALNASPSTFTAGLFDANGTGTGSNSFFFNGGSITLDFVGASVTPVPFHPAQTLGFAFVALGLGVRELKRRGLVRFSALGLA